MANTACWYQTQLPNNIIETLIEEVNGIDDNDFEDSKINKTKSGTIDSEIRQSKNCWIDNTSWVGGFLWNYIMRANRENFLYDISHIQYNKIQCTQYNVNDYYNWHTDQDIRTIFKPEQEVRKLSFSLQLSDKNEYVGGDLEFTDVDKKMFSAPRDRGCMIIFDSRTIHRVSLIESGVRKSLVGWVVGPRWK